MEKIETGKMLHSAFSVFLFNSKYELLLQQRCATKVTFPLVWTNTCCSHPLYRESELIDENALGVRNVAQRKLLDELGIPGEDVPVDQFTPLGRMLYKAPYDGKWGEHEPTSLILWLVLKRQTCCGNDSFVTLGVVVEYCLKPISVEDFGYVPDHVSYSQASHIREANSNA